MQRHPGNGQRCPFPFFSPARRQARLTALPAQKINKQRPNASDRFSRSRRSLCIFRRRTQVFRTGTSTFRLMPQKNAIGIQEFRSGSAKIRRHRRPPRPVTRRFLVNFCYLAVGTRAFRVQRRSATIKYREARPFLCSGRDIFPGNRIQLHGSEQGIAWKINKQRPSLFGSATTKTRQADPFIKNKHLLI